MVHRLVCHLHLRGPWVGASNIRLAVIGRWSGHGRMVLVDRLLHGDVYRQLRRGIGLGLSNRRWHVLCHQACCSRRPGPDLLVDSGLVQLAWSDGWSLECGLYRKPDAAGRH